MEEGYLLNIYSLENKKLKVKKVPENLEIFRKAIKNYCLKKREKTKLYSFDLLNDKDKFLFEIFYYENKTGKDESVKFTINRNIKGNFFLL